MTDQRQNDPLRESEQDLEKDAVWKLLLKARKTEVSPFFARNVLREVRQLEESEESRRAAGFAWSRLFTLPRVAFAGAAAILLAAIYIGTSAGPNAPVVDTGAPATATAPAPEIAATTPVPAVPEADDSANFDMGDYQEEIEMIDYLDGLLAIQDVESLDDAALAEILF